ncbi:MAG: helix-turn-helix domain-containing protein [Lachnospiraceae bacterium]
MAKKAAKSDFVVTDKKGNCLKVEQMQNELKASIMGEFVRLRKEKKVTQQILSERTGIARPNIARMENGTYNPTVDMLVRIADGLDMKVEINWVEK